MSPERSTSGKLLIARMEQEYETMSRYATGYGPDVDDFIFELPRKKTGIYSLRCHFIKTLYDYICEYSDKYQVSLSNNVLDEDKVVRLAFLAELVIDCQYYENYIFDGKNGVTYPDEVRRNLNAAALLKSEIFRYIRIHFQDEYGTAEKVRSCVDEIFNIVNVGQQMEADWCRYKNFKDGIRTMPDYGERVMGKTDPKLLKEIRDILLKGVSVSEDKVRFLEIYILRIYLTSGFLFSEFTDLLISLSGFQHQHSERIKRFVKIFGGPVVQIVNDNIDGVNQCTGTKISEDAFSDLRNKNITLPLFYFLTTQSPEQTKIRAILESSVCDGLIFETKIVSENGKKTKTLRPDVAEQVRNELEPVIKRYAIPAGRKIAGLAKNSIDTNLSAGKILADMTQMAFDNRFYRDMGMTARSSYGTDQNIYRKTSLASIFSSRLQWRKVVRGIAPHKIAFS